MLSREDRLEELNTHLTNVEDLLAATLEDARFLEIDDLAAYIRQAKMLVIDAMIVTEQEIQRNF